MKIPFYSYKKTACGQCEFAQECEQLISAFPLYKDIWRSIFGHPNKEKLDCGIFIKFYFERNFNDEYIHEYQ